MTHSLHHPTRDEEREAQKAHDVRFKVMHAAILKAVQDGADIPLRTESRVSPTGYKQYPLSSYLGECSSQAQKYLFHACMLAFNDDRADEIASALREFVDVVATEYAGDYADLGE